MKQVLVDCDGCLLDSRADDAFKQKVEEYGIEEALNWYTNNCPADLELNIAVFLQLLQYKVEGCVIVLWTNRGANQIDATLQNLALWGIHGLFDMFVFGDGNKTNTPLGNSIVIDNEWRNLTDAPNPVWVPTFTV